MLKRLVCAVVGHSKRKVPIEGEASYMVRCRRCGREWGQLMHGEWRPPQTGM